LEKFDSLPSRYSFSVISLPFSLSSSAKSLNSHKNLGVTCYRVLAEDDLILMKLESSAAKERLAIEFSSIVCIELKMKKLLMRTTNAKILAS